MLKAELVHCCLCFQFRLQKYVYGLTYSLLESNHLNKYNADYIIIPSSPFAVGVFVHAGLKYILQRLVDIVNAKEPMTTNNITQCRGQKREQEQKMGYSQRKGSLLDKMLKCCQFLYEDYQRLQEIYSPLCLSKLVKANYLRSRKQNVFKISEQEIISVYIEQLHNKIKISYNNQQNNSIKHPQLIPWINCPLFELNIVVPQIGMTTYICQCNDIVVVDPTEQFVSYLKFNKIVGNTNIDAPSLLTLLHTVILTKPTSVTAVLGLMTVQCAKKIRVIVFSKELENKLLKKGQQYLNMSEEIIRSRLFIRKFTNSSLKDSYQLPILSNNLNPLNFQHCSTLSCSFSPFSDSNLQLHFGCTQFSKTKRIKFYSSFVSIDSELELQSCIQYFPQQVKQNDVQYIIVYKANEELTKQLKLLPFQFRKKIILNRSEHKYNHKYFVTLQRNIIQHCVVVDSQYLVFINSNYPIRKVDIDKIVNDKQSKQVSIDKSIRAIIEVGQQPGCKIYQMGDLAELETVGCCVKVIQGLIYVQFMNNLQQKGQIKIFGRGKLLSNGFASQNKKVTALKYAEVSIIQLSHDYKTGVNSSLMNFATQQQQFYITESSYSQSESIDSFSLSKLPTSNITNMDHRSTNESNSLLSSLNLHQKQIINSLFSPITVKIDDQINHNNEYIYFISNGAMKWSDSNQIALNGYFIGDLKRFYKNKFSREEQQIESIKGNYIIAVKDTCALEINIQDFHRYFIIEYPHILYEMYMKSKIFN